MESCKSLQDIWIRMEADEEDCAAALKFWTNKKVLREISDSITGDTIYEIIENQQSEWDSDEAIVDQVRNSKFLPNSLVTEFCFL
jgi:hypothetical protein